MESLTLQFKNKTGHTLSAKLELPIKRQPVAYALFAHCFTCSKNLNAVRNISRSLTMHGIAVLRFDFTGLGDSEGDFADTNFSSNVSDLVMAANFLEANYQAPEIIIGHSLGGAAVLQAAASLPAVKAVVTLGAPADPPHVKHLFKESLEEIKRAGMATVNIGGRPFKIKQQFLEDLEGKSLQHTIKNMGKALLVMHSPQDNTVGIDNARKLYEMAMHPKSFITLDGADHLLSRKEDSLYAGQMIAAWSSRYITPLEEDVLETDKHVVTRTGEDGYTTLIKAGNHSLLADEPTSVGGKDLGPTPYGMLLAGLGACTGMTLRMYADRKGWNLKEVNVHLEHNKDHAKDCEECENKEQKIDIIDRVLEIEGDLSAAQKEKLLEIADKCPVHRTLSSEVLINTQMSEQVKQ